jgi:hypothetical protein
VPQDSLVQETDPHKFIDEMTIYLKIHGYNPSLVKNERFRLILVLIYEDLNDLL